MLAIRKRKTKRKRNLPVWISDKVSFQWGRSLTQLRDAGALHNWTFLLPRCEFLGFVMVRIHPDELFPVIIENFDLPMMMLAASIFTERCGLAPHSGKPSWCVRIRQTRTIRLTYILIGRVHRDKCIIVASSGRIHRRHGLRGGSLTTSDGPPLICHAILAARSHHWMAPTAEACVTNFFLQR